MKTLKQFGIGMLIAMNAFAQGGGGDRVGNGGDAVVCADRVYMLDTYDLERKHKLVDFGNEKTSIRSMVNEAIKRIGSKDALLEESIKQNAEILLTDVEALVAIGAKALNGSFMVNTEFTNDELVNVADEGAASIPRGCKIEQLIIQSLKPAPGEKRFKVQVGLWLEMADVEKAVAIVHEAIYGYLLTKNASNSYVTRYVNGLIVSGDIIFLSDKAYMDLLKELSFPLEYMGVKGAKFSTGQVMLYNSAKHEHVAVENLIFNEKGDLVKVKVAEFNEPGIPVLGEGRNLSIGKVAREKTWMKADFYHFKQYVQERYYVVPELNKFFYLDDLNTLYKDAVEKGFAGKQMFKFEFKYGMNASIESFALAKKDEKGIILYGSKETWVSEKKIGPRAKFKSQKNDYSAIRITKNGIISIYRGN